MVCSSLFFAVHLTWIVSLRGAVTAFYSEAVAVLLFGARVGAAGGEKDPEMDSG